MMVFNLLTGYCISKCKDQAKAFWESPGIYWLPQDSLTDVFHPVASHRLTYLAIGARVYKGNLKFPTCAPLNGDFSVKIPLSPKK